MPQNVKVVKDSLVEMELSRLAQGDQCPAGERAAAQMEKKWFH